MAFDTAAIQNSVVHAAGITLPWGITYLALTVVYWWLPNTKVSFKQVLPISLATAIVFELAKLLFVTYLRYDSDRLFSIYGSFVALMMFFIFVYVEALIMLGGAMICAKWTRYLSASNQGMLIDDSTGRIDNLANRVRVLFADQG